MEEEKNYILDIFHVVYMRNKHKQLNKHSSYFSHRLFLHLLLRIFHPKLVAQVTIKQYKQQQQQQHQDSLYYLWKIWKNYQKNIFKVLLLKNFNENLHENKVF